MIHLSNINLSFGSQVIFNDLSCTIKDTDRIGLVGNNGSGKSTLLRIIARQQAVDSGSVNILAHTSIGYMPQDLTLTSEKTIIDEAITGCVTDETSEQALKAEAKQLLAGLGFKNDQYNNTVNTLSVGWKMRLLLCQLLLQKADFYLFDEPTNHLDIVAQEWFLSFLKNAPFGFMLVCHDRYFLDQLCASILELENGSGTRYRGNYSSYQEQKAARMATLQAQYNNQQRDIARKQKTIDRFRAQASRARMVKKMERELDRIELVVLPNTIKTIHFSFPEAPPAGKVVLEVTNLSYAFSTKQIFRNLSFTIQRGERVAIIAANGVGKTTLFNVISGVYQPQSGTIAHGHNVHSAYFQQNQLTALDPEKTVLETVVQHAPTIKAQEVKDLLGCFLFSNELSAKKIRVLSGGEKNRVCMAYTLLQQANFLMLDEPTNHLDIQSKDILLNALLQYTGTILFVSHDHTFVNELATAIIELTPTSAHKYLGNYEHYLEQKKALEPVDITPITQKVAKPKPIRQTNERVKIEQRIKKLEAQVHELSTKLAELTYNTPEFVTTCAKLKEAQACLDQELARWEEAYRSEQQ